MADRKTLGELDLLLAELNGDLLPPKQETPATSSNGKKPGIQQMDELEQLVTSLQQNDLTPSKPAAPSQPTPAGSIPELARRTTSTASVSGKDCARCGKTIEGDITVALNKPWHLNCLTCNQCSTVINGDFYEHEGKQVCKNCMASKIRCSKCGQAIVKDYFIGDGKIFHPTCVDVLSCAKCHNVIEPTQTKLTALGKTFHHSCFTCTNCNTQLGVNFYQKDGKPFCENCSKTNIPGGGMCSTCGQSIKENTQFVRYDNSVYHQNCFVCHRCKGDLDLSAFYNVGGKPTCNNCVVQLSK